jgi:hypothetical protein
MKVNNHFTFRELGNVSENIEQGKKQARESFVLLNQIYNENTARGEVLCYFTQRLTLDWAC